jgi:sigma-B regulation protein RsbU (phosphoserine phosphatase)
MMISTKLDDQEEILVVDDTLANLRLLAQILSDRGYKVRAVTSGNRAIESAEASPPSLILLDIRMPGLNGFEVCQKLKSIEHTKDIPIIFVSALDDLQDKVNAFHAGGVDYITKPYQVEEILARTETHLALRKLQKQLQDTNRRYKRELTLAGSVQKSFLPRELPNFPGWQVAARLVPSHETSGDFYDFIPLSDGHLGILIADVVDKGAGAALFMAYTWSMIRTYLSENPTDLVGVFERVNSRILQDTQLTEYVTTFLGVLVPSNGSFIYSNAGHCPAILVQVTHGTHTSQLKITGMPLGVDEKARWGQQLIQLNPGDLLVLYTDGISEAMNTGGDLFGLAHLQDLIHEAIHLEASQLLERILCEVDAFTNKETLNDDIALVVIKRNL